MNNYDYPLGADTKFSPWNEKDSIEQCPSCGSSDLELFDCGTYKGVEWQDYICNDCGYTTNNEPDEYDYE